ncbi:uncharacterized protein SPSC_02717 [Sporisorium scitamineum]|uniref:Uncharacterized protein n=1 Tax=Sporisorium scitamineum TaxID=49012 RepID=A0A127ZD89_9BASI|nr:uncharacterized protein SPSC_02717 [Sporisorium scitamineum]
MGSRSRTHGLVLYALCPLLEIPRRPFPMRSSAFAFVAPHSIVCCLPPPNEACVVVLRGAAQEAKAGMCSGGWLASKRWRAGGLDPPRFEASCLERPMRSPKRSTQKNSARVDVCNYQTPIVRRRTLRLVDVAHGFAVETRGTCRCTTLPKRLSTCSIAQPPRASCTALNRLPRRNSKDPPHRCFALIVSQSYRAVSSEPRGTVCHGRCIAAKGEWLAAQWRYLNDTVCDLPGEVLAGTSVTTARHAGTDAIPFGKAHPDPETHVIFSGKEQARIPLNRLLGSSESWIMV